MEHALLSLHPDKSTGANNTPNGAANGNHGLIGGNGSARSEDNHFAGAEQNRSRMSADGRMNRMESNRGRDSMAGRILNHAWPGNTRLLNTISAAGGVANRARNEGMLPNCEHKTKKSEG